MSAQNSTDFMLAPGEQNVYGDRFTESVVLPYLKAQLMCSSTRFVFKDPNTLLGLIPLGANESSIPLSSIASVSVSSHFRLGRALLAIILLILGFAMITDWILPCLLMIVLGLLMIVTVFPSVLLVQNHAGMVTAIEVAVIERKRLAAFCSELQARVFADQSAIHNQEAQTLRAQQLTLQQMAFQQQMALQQNGGYVPGAAQAPQVGSQQPAQLDAAHHRQDPYPGQPGSQV